MLDAVQLCLTCLHLIVVLVVLGYLSYRLSLCGGLRIGLATLGSRCSLGIRLGRSRCLSRSSALLLFLLLFFLFRLLGNTGKLGLLSEFLKFDLEVSGIQVLSNLLEPVWYIGGLVGTHQDINGG